MTLHTPAGGKRWQSVTVAHSERRRGSAELTFSFFGFLRRLLPLVRLHHLHSSPENEAEAWTHEEPEHTAPTHDVKNGRTYLQMSRAFLASPDTADTFLAQN